MPLGRSTFVPLADERIVRDSLRPILSHTLADVLAFDDAFDRFFHARPFAKHDPRLQDREPLTAATRSAHNAVDVDARSQFERTTGVALHHNNPVVGVGVDDEQDEREPQAVRLQYSPLEGEAPPPVLDPPDDEWRSAARMLVNRLQGGLSRRWRGAPRGRRFDLRRTLRGSLHTSGEPVVPRWRARQRRRPRFVILVDGSRSMGRQAVLALQFASAIAAVATNAEVFTFSTAVHRVTREIARAAAGTRVRLPPLHQAWGGGTSIGASLQDVLRRAGDRWLGRDTVVVIASDGLEAGDPAVLRDAMSRLHRASAAIVWLNPLLETSGYQPSAQGMRAARPYVTTFGWVSDAVSLLQLARTAHVRT